MWHKEYRDYKIDQPQVKQTIEPSHGIVGCEMHDINGWGNTLQHPPKKKRGFIYSFLSALFKSKKTGKQ